MSSKGEITKAELCERSKEELAKLYHVFSKYLSGEEENEHLGPPKHGPIEGKVKIANKIYRKACLDSGVSLCFFKNFGAWHQFVHGEIEENEFYAKAIEEIRKLGDEGRSYN
jgi:hypothetical protein